MIEKPKIQGNSFIAVPILNDHYLEKFIYKAYGSIMTRLTMEVIRQSDKKIEDYYELKEHDELSSSSCKKHSQLSALP